MVLAATGPLSEAMAAHNCSALVAKTSGVTLAAGNRFATPNPCHLMCLQEVGANQSFISGSRTPFEMALEMAIMGMIQRME